MKNKFWKFSINFSLTAVLSLLLSVVLIAVGAYATYKIFDLEGLRWTMKLLYNFFDIVSSFSLYFIILLVILLAGIINYLLTRRTTKRMNAILDAVSRIQKGEYNVLLPNDNHDTLGELEQDINSLAIQINNTLNQRKEIEQSKDDFIVNIAHDLRTPLTSIIGYLSFIREKQLDPEISAKYAGIAFEKSGQLERTIDNNLNEPSESRETTTGNTDPDTDSSDKAQSNAVESEWCLILVNKWNPIPDDYEMELTKLTKLTNGQSVDKRIYPALQEMFNAARNDGVYPVVASGYRTTEEQQRLMDEKIAAYKAEGYSAKEAATKAEAWVSIPGTSEHQIGIAVDINADGIHSTGDEVYEWLDQNAYKFGFICRYPSDKTEITGVINEPWHYRYVGIDAATEIHNQGVCLEEYL